MLQFVAPLLRAHVTSGRDQLGSLASLTSQQLDAAASASAAAVKAKLCEVQELLRKISVYLLYGPRLYPAIVIQKICLNAQV